MNDSEPGVLQRLRRRIRRVPPLLLVVLGAVVAVLMVWGAVEAYRAYDYVQHDNDFCLSCHLMVEPYERFARSAHRELGCKACHRPTLVTRSTMALTQVLENPDTLEAHAEVPNDVCVECHVEGDPQSWRNVAATAGHRIHLESGDPALADLECVECHSTSVHEFAPSDRTCGQAGCHENQDIQLGGMGALTIHCATCHTFTEPVAEVAEDSVRLALQPQREECLSCHAMRTRLGDFPLEVDDPHGGMCGACHNPHAQAEPAEAFESCTTCHTQPDTITPYHRGLAAGVLETCSRCHAAHTFHTEGRDCRSCHTDPANPANVTPASGSAPPAQRTSLLHSAVRVLVGLLLPSPAFAQQTPIGFDHGQHTQVECTACH
ncbi:MAG TPA: cytochrome c3 family protein, partial [Longimicrobiales bacterium]